MNARAIKFLQGSLSLACAAALTFSLRAGNDYYVDANFGDDSWDGSTATIPTDEQRLLGTVSGPRKTLAGAMAITGLKSGDTVHAAPGVYNEGGMENSCGSNRVIVANGVLLVADQGASVTTIEGKISTAEGNVNGCAADSMRAVCMGSGAVLKGFTVTKGRSNPDKSESRPDNGDAGGIYQGLAVECVFSNNVAYYRGNVSYDASLLRCYIGDDPAGYYSCYASSRLIDCVHDSSKYCYSYVKAYNTTFVRGYMHGAGASAYNCLFLERGGNGAYNNCISTFAIGSGTDPDGTSLFSVDKSELAYDTRTFRLLPGSIAIDAGKDAYYVNAVDPWTGVKEWWRTFVGKDYAGGERIRGAAIDVGAGEFDPDARRLTITDSQTALVVTGAEKGSTFLYEGQTNTFTLARDYSTAKLLSGIRVNGEFFSFTGENSDKTYTYTYGYGDPVANFVVEAVYAEHNDWYVNANTDPENGPVGDDTNSGYTKYSPKRTLAGAMSNALLTAGDVVHAAPGVYNEGTMAASQTSTFTNRVIIKAGVGLVSDGGKEVTAIEGFIPEESKWGTTDPVSGVVMGNNAYVKGFTIRNAMASMKQVNDYILDYSGGGVKGGTAIDCVISNCYAVRGGGAAEAKLIRCRLVDNMHFASGTLNSAGGKANVTGANFYWCYEVCDSYIGGAATACSKAINSHFGTLNHNSGKCLLYNCYVNQDNGNLVLTNSIVAGALNGKSTLGAGSVTGIRLKFDADGRPDATDPTTAEYAIDKGNRDYYVYPSAFAHEAGRDFAGGQRIYNGRIDIGCGEYDARGDFGKALGAKKSALAIDVATPDVTTNALGRIALPDGAGLKLALTLPLAGPVTIALDKTAGVTVTLDGAEIAPGSGGFVFAGSPGEHIVTISYSGEGSAAITRISLPSRGTVMILR